MKELNYGIFEDLMDRFKYSPKPYNLLIICENDEDLAIFKKIINSFNITWNSEKESKYYLILTKENKRIKIIKGLNNFSAREGRVNTVIYNYKFPLDIITEILLPLANIEPSYGGLFFNKRNIIEWARLIDNKNEDSE